MRFAGVARWRGRRQRHLLRRVAHSSFSGDSPGQPMNSLRFLARQEEKEEEKENFQSVSAHLKSRSRK